MDFQQFIKPELLVLIPVLFLIGEGIKHSKIADWLIPFILGGVGIILACLYIVASELVIISTQSVATAIFSAVTQGILCAGASVYVDQIIKQAKKGD